MEIHNLECLINNNNMKTQLQITNFKVFLIFLTASHMSISCFIFHMVINLQWIYIADWTPLLTFVKFNFFFLHFKKWHGLNISCFSSHSGNNLQWICIENWTPLSNFYKINYFLFCYILRNYMVYEYLVLAPIGWSIYNKFTLQTGPPSPISFYKKNFFFLTF